ncbi:hypothetical protein ABIB25_004982 [Nakamurella sp. UYEF19]|uniref:hypothetical protein n=1 Tax=Nakamurella sp. UYEF19 TaxID=1756392 RepID=UPI003393013F
MALRRAPLPASWQAAAGAGKVEEYPSIDLHSREGRAIMVLESKRTGADGYDDLPVPGKLPKGERAAVIQYLETDEAVWLRQPVQAIGEIDGRVLLRDAVVVLVTDRKLVAARTSGGFRPHWEVFTLPYGHLEPGVLVEDTRGTDVAIPTSGRRSYRVELADAESASRLAGSLGVALRAYRRDRMGLQDL